MKISKLLPVLASLILGGSLANAAIYLVDFNTAGYSGYPDASTWNIFAAPADVTGTLVDSTGAASTLGISQSGDVTDNGNFPSLNAGNSWYFNSTNYYNTAGDVFAGKAEAASDSFGTTTEYTVNISGLAGLTFGLEVVGGGKSGDGTWTGFYSYSLDGGTNWSGFTAYTPTNTVRIADTSVATASGYRVRGGDYFLPNGGAPIVTLTGDVDVLMLKAVNNTGSAGAGFNALMLTTVPEPATYALLLGFGALGLVFWHRRQLDR